MAVFNVEFITKAVAMGCYGCSVPPK